MGVKKRMRKRTAFRKGDQVMPTKAVRRAILDAKGIKIDQKGEVVRVFHQKDGDRVIVRFPDYPGLMVCNPDDIEQA